ncbi:MAG: hypothetical protein N2Z21_04980 [Candidatus Sumerlaeaceae bacterium]|nr:hypothetical protein [Candidatus Sumerlaeaceae bacterium]
MKITLEKGENLEVIIVDKDKVVGKLLLQLLAQVAVPSEKTSQSELKADTPAKKPRKRTLSPEARERLAQAQRERWARVRAMKEQQGGGQQA